MKKAFSLILALFICLSCVGCGSSSAGANSNEQAAAVELPKNIQMYVPGTTIETDFGSVTVMDAAFTTKVQIYYTKSSRSSKTTINGKATENYEETIHPGYLSTMDNKMVFALKTVMTNTTSEDIEIQKLSVKATFVEGNSVYFSKGGNFHISDEAYTILPAGASSEIVLAALLPIDQYLLATECLLEIGGAELGFTYDSINVYNVLGFQEGDNTTITIDEVIVAAQNAVSSAHTVKETEAETEPEETDPPIETFAGTNKKDGTAAAEGRAIKIENVSVGFCDVLPKVVREDSFYSRRPEKYAIDDNQTYAVVNFRITNLTSDEIVLVDAKGNFVFQLTYNNNYRYSTFTQAYAWMVSNGNYGMVHRWGTSVSTGGMAVSPLASVEVSAYISCAKVVAEDSNAPLSVTFISKFSGNESLDFVIR